jgi:hypothetical protein
MFLRPTLVAALLVATMLLSGLSRPLAKPVVILFVGNSFFHGATQPVLTYNAAAITDENFTPNRKGQRQQQYVHEPGPWGGIPGIFKKLTEEAGLAYDVHLEALSGKALKFHYDSALATIQQPRWDVVVLHDHSSGPVPARHGGQPARFVEYANRLEQAIHSANPKAQLYLYETWARADQTYPATGGYAGLPLDSMTADLHRAYYQEAARNGHFAGVAPAGDAWLRAIETGVALRNPYQPDATKLDLWGQDHGHPSPWGAYLNACVLFGEITGRDPRRFGGQEQAAAALGIAPAQAVALQRVAWQQLRAAKELGGQGLKKSRK